MSSHDVFASHPHQSEQTPDGTHPSDHHDHSKEKVDDHDDRVKYDILSPMRSMASISDFDHTESLPPIAGLSSLIELEHTSSASTTSSRSSLKSRPKGKQVTFSDAVDSNQSKPMTTLITSSTPVPSSIRRLHNDAVYSKFIEFLERGRPMRRFIREGLFNWKRRLLSKRKEVVVHLFSDMISFSTKNADGYLFLLEKFKLKDCRVERDGSSLTITCGSQVMMISASNQHVAVAWSNNIEDLCRWCKEGEAGLMPVMASPDLEMAFASAHSRSISVALKEEIEKRRGSLSMIMGGHSRSNSMAARLHHSLQQNKAKTQRFEMSWEYAVDQMNLMKSSMKSAKVGQVFDEEMRSRAVRQLQSMKERIQALKAGDTLFKYDRLGACHRRFYQIDKDEETLIWVKSSTSNRSSDSELICWTHFESAVDVIQLEQILLASISNIVIGPQTKRFHRYLNEGRQTPWLCFSLISFSPDSPTVDLECSTAQQVRGCAGWEDVPFL